MTDFTLTPDGLRLSEDTALLYPETHLRQLLLSGSGLRHPRKVCLSDLFPSPSAPLTLDLVQQHLFAPLTAEDYAAALDWATTPAAVGIIHGQVSALDAQLQRIRAAPLTRLHGWLKVDGTLSEVQFSAGDRWQRWHHSLGLQRIWWDRGPVTPLNRFADMTPAASWRRGA